MCRKLGKADVSLEVFLKALELSRDLSKSQKRTSRNIVHHTDKQQMSLVQEQLADKGL
jgi:hypothetical protein